MYRSRPSVTRRGYMGGPMREQSFVCHDDPSPNWGVSYGAHFKSTRPHCVARIVNMAMCGPRYNTNVCRPEPVQQQFYHSTTMQEDAYISQKPVKLIESTLVALALSHLVCTDEQTTRCFQGGRGNFRPSQFVVFLSEDIRCSQFTGYLNTY